jgi:hypothetical protein
VLKQCGQILLEEVVEGFGVYTHDLGTQAVEVEAHSATQDVGECLEGSVLVHVVHAHGRHVAHTLHVPHVWAIAGIDVEQVVQSCCHGGGILKSMVFRESAWNIIFNN